MSGIGGQSIDEVLDQHVKTHLREIFFTKLRDWASEMEYRLVLVTGDERPVYVGIESAMRAVLLGERVSDYYLPALAALCSDKKIPIFKVRWPYGRPSLETKVVP